MTIKHFREIQTGSPLRWR